MFLIQLRHLFSDFADQNETLAPYYEIDQKFFDQKVREMVFRYNYTLNPIGVYEAIKYMYTYWPAPQNTTHMRDQYVHVSIEGKYHPHLL